MDSYGTIQDGQLHLSSEQKELRKRYLSSIKSGTLVRETITKVGKKGTLAQGGAHFGLVVETIRQRFIDTGIDVCGIAPNKDMIHEILKKACGGVGDMGETMRFRDMTIEQRIVFFRNCRTWCATQLSLNIPDPDPLWQEKRNLKANDT